MIRKNRFSGFYPFTFFLKWKPEYCRWGLGEKDLTTMTEWKSATNKVIEVNEENFLKHLDVNIVKDFFQVKGSEMNSNINKQFFR